MYRIDNASAFPALVAPTGDGPVPGGFFSAGNANAGQAGTIVDAEFVNMLQEELANCITNEGKLDPILNKSLRNQLLGAIRRECSLITSGGGGPTPTIPLEYYTASRVYTDRVYTDSPGAITLCSQFTIPPGVWDLWGHIGFYIDQYFNTTELGGCVALQNEYGGWVDGATGRSTVITIGDNFTYSRPQLLEFYCGRALVAFNTPTSVYLQGVQYGNGPAGQHCSLYGFMAARRLGLPPGGLDAAVEALTYTGTPEPPPRPPPEPAEVDFTAEP